ncbi:MAG: hypothetical protein ACPGCW_04325 [Schleiferiaceae bacterium]|jgi:hypothetical protein|tara:strand:+ start:191 stop:424 length:234 start_codon:yes stop_codon:yes gene_type:complete
MKTKTTHEIDHTEITRVLSVLKNEPNFKRYIELREAMREETIRALQNPSNIENLNLHFYISGKLEAIDEELDMFYKL